MVPVAVGPQPDAAWLQSIVVDGGGVIVAPEDADVLVWGRHAGDGLPEFIDRCRSVRWVQLPAAGIEWMIELGLGRSDITWTSARGVFRDAVAEHAIALLLAGFRGLHDYLRTQTWLPESGRRLDGARVAILGAGGIAESVVQRLRPFGVDTTVLGRDATASDQLHTVLAASDAVILALPLTPATKGMIGEAELATMKPDAWLVNVARGGIVDTDALVSALRAGRIGGAALDVTDPEPLPDGHPLWSMSNVILTPHVASTLDMGREPFAARVSENLRRWAADEPLLGVVDETLGY